MLVDALLDFLPQQRAQGLIVEPGKAPALMRGSERKTLSMPGLDAGMVEDILAEVTDEGERQRVAAGQELATRHRTGGGIEFDVLITRGEGGLRLVFRKAKAKPETAAASPASAPVAAPTTPPTAAPEAVPASAAEPRTRAEPNPRLADPVVNRSSAPELDDLLERALLQGASDVFVSRPGGVRMRVGAQLSELRDTGLDAAQLPAYLAELWPRIEPVLARQGSVDFALEVGLGPRATRFRVNLFRELGGLAAVFRPVRREPPTLHGLGLGDELAALTEFNTGLVLMTGQAGAGKSTTLVALLEQLNRSRACHIITLEDPIEYVYRPGRALIHQRELGVHVDSFASGLRAALRESPDIILVGEMRDRETISAALTAAETGHLVLSTLHCGDAGAAVNRVVDVFSEHQQQQVREQLAASLRAVVTQFMLPGLRAPRVPAYELMRVNVPVAAKIREHRGHQLRSEIVKGRAEGMVPLELSLARLVRERRVAPAQARRLARDPRLLEELVRGS